MSEKDEEEANKENFDESRTDTSMSNSTFNTTTSSQRVENQEAVVDEQGFLDLKNLQLTHLSKNLRPDYLKTKSLDVSNNEFRYFNYMDVFKNLEILNAADNLIQKFQAVHHLKLRELNLSNNQLKSIASLCRFENLTKLDVSCNSLEGDFSLNLPNLLHLDLLGNSLTQIPDLSKCEKLVFLHLSANKIANLDNLSYLISPKSLEILDISSNDIADLSQLSNLTDFKNLEFLYTSNNPCMNTIDFDARAYIVAVCGEKLEQIDGLDIEDDVRTQGEWLSIQGQVRKIASGNHDELCAKIRDNFPSEQMELPLTPAQLTCKKVLKKRQESETSRTSERTDVSSAYSPFREWNGKMEENLGKIHLHNNTTSTPKRNTDDDKKRLNSSMRICSPPSTRKSTEPMFQFKNQDVPKYLHRTDSTDSTLTVVLSSSRHDPTPTPILDRNESRTPSVADVAVVDETMMRNDLEKRVNLLEEQMSEMMRQNQNLTKLNEELTDFFMSFIKNQTPTPKNLKFTPLSGSNDTYVVKWDLPIVEGYEIWIDGNKCGRVIGKNNTARVTDLDENLEHTVQVRAISSNGSIGELSEPLQIPKLKK